MRRATGIAAICASMLMLSGGLAARQGGSQTTQQQSATPQAGQTTQEHGTGTVPQGVTLVPEMPPAGAPRPFHFPSAATKTLPNGLRVFVVTDHSEPAVAAELLVLSAGTIKDPPQMPGVAEMTANLLNQGTQKRSAQEIAEAIDFVGGSLDASAGPDATQVSLSIMKKDWNLGMDLMSDIVLHPAFQEEELERQQQQLLSGLSVNYSDPNYLASTVFSRVVYGSSPYGWPGEGTPETVAKLDRATLAKFHDSTYAPNQSLLAFAGDVTPEEAFAAAEKYFGGWQRVTAVPPSQPAAAQPVSGMHIWLIDKPDAVQTQIRVGSLGMRRADPNYIPALVTNRIFGGGYNSRLNTEVRVKKGLTYGANSSFNAHRYAGSFAVGTYTRTEKTVETTQLVVQLIGQMATGNVSPQEMDFARDYLAGVYPIQSETAEQVAGRVLTVAAFGLAPDFNSTYPDRVRAVTAAQVQAMAKRYFTPDNLEIVLAGNVAAFRDVLKSAFPKAQYEEIPFDQIDVLAPGLRKAKPAASGAGN